MRQTTKLQYHYYHPSEFDFPLYSFFSYSGNKVARLTYNLCYTYAQEHPFNPIGGSGASARLGWQIGSNT